MAQRQHLIAIHYDPPSSLYFPSCIVLSDLGPQAESAVPELIEIYDHSRSVMAQRTIPAVFGSIGPGARRAVPLLVRNSTHTDEGVRRSAISALGGIHAEPEQAVPALVKALQDPSAPVRTAAFRALDKFGTEARAAFPALLEFRKDLSKNVRSGSFPNFPGYDFRSDIDRALWRIDPEAAQTAGVKPVQYPFTIPSTSAR
jgi:HEAT repeat protein